MLPVAFHKAAAAQDKGGVVESREMRYTNLDEIGLMDLD